MAENNPELENVLSIDVFDDTSVARPSYLLPQLAESDGLVTVFSAPGVDVNRGAMVEASEMLQKLSAREYCPEDIQDRFNSLVIQMDPDSENPKLRDVIDGIPRDIEEWQERGRPLEVLSGRWATELYALQTGRELIDPADIIYFDADGRVDQAKSEDLIKDVIESTRRYAVAGDSGADKNGAIHLLPGGSSVTAAIIARAMAPEGVREYRNFSNIGGYMTADPGIVHDAKLIPLLDYGEARILAAAGYEPLNRDAAKILANAAITTVMCNTFDEVGNRGTLITPRRPRRVSILSARHQDDELLRID